MQQSQKALLKYLSAALVCSLSSASPVSFTSSNSTPAAESREARRSIDRNVATTVDAGDSSIIHDEALAQSVYSLIGGTDDAFYIISKNVRIFYEQEQLHKALMSFPCVVLKGLAAAIYYPEPWGTGNCYPHTRSFVPSRGSTKLEDM